MNLAELLRERRSTIRYAVTEVSKERPSKPFETHHIAHLANRDHFANGANRLTPIFEFETHFQLWRMVRRGELTQTNKTTKNRFFTQTLYRRAGR